GGRFRGDGGGPGRGGAAAGELVRPGGGAGVSEVPRGQAAGADRQRQPGAATDLSALGGPLEALRTSAGAALRPPGGCFGDVGRSGDGLTPTLIAPGAARQAGQKNSCHRDHDSRRKTCVHHLLSLVRPTIRTTLCTGRAWKRGVGGPPSP